MEMSYPWIKNGEVKNKEKTTKYSQLRLELMNRYPTYHFVQHNIIIHLLGRYSREVEHNIKELVGYNNEAITYTLQMYRRPP